MSTESPSTASTTPHEIKIYSHASIFYWWPVWLVGFILALLTIYQGTYMVLVPTDSITFRVEREADREVHSLVLPEGMRFPAEERPHLRVPTQRGYGVIFATVLLVVIFITNVPLRGMWSVLIIVMIIMLSIIFALAGWWDKILEAIYWLDIRINAGGYMFISLGLLILWMFAFFFFDRQRYFSFVPGAMKVRLEIGAGEKQYGTIGMTIERERGDIFRHWILGLGSGDLIVRTAGADQHEFRLPNVLFINQKMSMIEEMQRVRQVHATSR